MFGPNGNATVSRLREAIWIEGKHIAVVNCCRGLTRSMAAVPLRMRRTASNKKCRAGVPPPPNGGDPPSHVQWDEAIKWFDPGTVNKESSTREGIGRVGAFYKTGLSSVDRGNWTKADRAEIWFSLGVYKFVCEELGDNPFEFELTGVLKFIVNNVPIAVFPAVKNTGLANLPERIRPARGCFDKYDGGPGYYCTIDNVCGKTWWAQPRACRWL